MKKAILLLMALALFAAAGCGTTVIDRQYMRLANDDLGLANVLGDPKAAQGQYVVWGGKIVRTIVRQRGTLVEVVQFPLDDDQHPVPGDRSQGRFIVAMPGYLEPFVYHRGRDVTVAGQVVGVEKLPHGQIRLSYVLLRGKEIYVWPQQVPVPQPVMPEVEFGLGAGIGPEDAVWWQEPYMWW